MKRHQFTLMELILVLAVVLLISAIAVPFLARHDAETAETVSRKICALLDGTRTQAVFNHTVLEVTVTPGGSVLELGVGRIEMPSVDSGSLSAEDKRRFTQTYRVPDTVELVFETPLSPDENRFCFFPDGLTSFPPLHVRSDTETYRIFASPLTGTLFCEAVNP